MRRREWGVILFTLWSWRSTIVTPFPWDPANPGLLDRDKRGVTLRYIFPLAAVDIQVRFLPLIGRHKNNLAVFLPLLGSADGETKRLLIFLKCATEIMESVKSFYLANIELCPSWKDFFPHLWAYCNLMKVSLYQGNYSSDIQLCVVKWIVMNR